MQEAADRLLATFQQNAAVIVSYTRGGSTLVGINATVGRTPFEVVEGSVMITRESRDYIIARTDLAIDGDMFAPASGDRITEADGRVYEVAAPRGFNVYESIGPDGTVLKIHTVGPK